MGLINSVLVSLQWEFWIVTILSAFTIGLLVWTSTQIVKTSNYTWLLWMIWLLVIADIFILATATGYVIEDNIQYNNEHLLLLQILTAVGTAGYNLFLNLFHWLFGFEYLKVSFGFRDSGDTDKKLPHRKFNIIKVVGIVLNFLPAIPLCYYEWVLEKAIQDTENYGTPIPSYISRWIIVSECANILLVFISVAVLGWALLRISH